MSEHNKIDNHDSHAEDDKEKIVNDINYFGLTDFRGQEEKFGIKADDRTRHMYVIGKTGMGKSTLLENLAIQDIQNGNGLCFVDPHGTTAEKLLRYVPESRIHDVIYFAPFDTAYPMSLNILEHVAEDKRHLVSSGLMDTFKKVFGEDVFSGRMVYLLNNAVLSLLENEGESLLGINRIFSDKEYRKKIIANVKDPALLSFWNDEFAKYEDRYVKEATAAIQNKIGQFIMTPMIRNIVGQKKNSFDMREIMDTKKILICNFSLGQTGSENVNLLGSLLITKIYLAAMSRANLNYEDLQKAAPFYFYVDEFQNFVNDSFAQILSQARKYNLGLVVANQYVEEQLTDKVRAAIFGNVGTFVCFRVGAPDAEEIEKEFAPNFTAEDLVNLGARQIYLKLSIGGVGSKPFSAKTMPPIVSSGESFLPAILAMSRIQFAKEKGMVESEIQEWYKPIINPKPANDNNDTHKTYQNNSYANTNPSNHKTGSNSNNYLGKNKFVESEKKVFDRVHHQQNKIENIQYDKSDDKSFVDKSYNKFENKNSENKEPKHITENKPNTSLRDALSGALAMKVKEDDKAVNSKNSSNFNENKNKGKLDFKVKNIEKDLQKILDQE